MPHYFRHLYDSGAESVAPRVEYASALESTSPRCVVSIIGCTGDWTGGWDNTPPGGVDRFITADLASGRMVDVIQRGEPALMLAHWTGIYWNGQELGFRIFQEVVRRLNARFDNLVWMKVSEVARYWAAKELTRIERTATGVSVSAPFACPAFTVRVETPGSPSTLKEVSRPLDLVSGTWVRSGRDVIVCVDLSKGATTIPMRS